MSNDLRPRDVMKRTVGEYAVQAFVKNGMALGLGTGTTAIWAVREIARKYHAGELRDIHCAVTGPGTALESAKLGLPVYDLNASHVQYFDVTIDGADEYDEMRNLTKGGGGCLFHEKIIAYSSEVFVCVADVQKKVTHLGASFRTPIEVIPVAVSRVIKILKSMFDVSELAVRYDVRGVSPFITVEGNYILDVSFASSFIPEDREREINAIVGVVECGIFPCARFATAPILCVIDDTGSVQLYK